MNSGIYRRGVIRLLKAIYEELQKINETLAYLKKLQQED